MINLKPIINDIVEYLDNEDKLRAYLMDIYPEAPKDLIAAIVFILKNDISKILTNGQFQINTIKSITAEGLNNSIKQENVIEALKILGDAFDADTQILDLIEQEKKEEYEYDEFSGYVPGGIVTITLKCSHCGSDLDFNGYCTKCGQMTAISDYFPEYAGTNLYKNALQEDPNAMYNLGKQYYDDKNLDLSLRKKKSKYWFEHAANKGLIKAWNELAILAATDMRLFSDNMYEKINASHDAQLVFYKGSLMGNAYCCFFLRDAYFTGDYGANIDVVRGLKDLSDIAEDPRNVEAVATANSLLGQIYVFGKYGVQKDYNRGFNYLKKAVEKHDEAATLFIAQCYENGYGVTANDSEALKYYRKAAQYGIEPAIEYIKNFEANTARKAKINIDKFLELKKQHDLKKQAEIARKKAEEERERKIRKQNAIQEYWEKHEEEYKEINDKIKSLENEIVDLQKYINDKNNEIIDLNNERQRKTQEEIQFENRLKTLNELKDNLSKLPFYKIFAKANIKKEIESQESIFKKEQAASKESRLKTNTEYESKINSIKSEISKYKSKMTSLEKEIKELKNVDPVGDNF